MARMLPTPSAIEPQSVLTAREFQRLRRLLERLPPNWIATCRRRRLLFLALAAPGFFAFFGTIYHRSFLVMAIGLLLFACAAVLRLLTEPLLVRAEAAHLLPRPLPRSEVRKEKPLA